MPMCWLSVGFATIGDGGRDRVVVVRRYPECLFVALSGQSDRIQDLKYRLLWHVVRHTSDQSHGAPHQ